MWHPLKKDMKTYKTEAGRTAKSTKLIFIFLQFLYMILPNILCLVGHNWKQFLRREIYSNWKQTLLHSKVYHYLTEIAHNILKNFSSTNTK